MVRPGRVSKLLDFTQARLGGGLRIERRPTDLHEIIKLVLDEVEAKNALKYSPEGSPVLIATHSHHDSVELTVTNRGAPIPAERLGTLFQPFQRTTEDLDRTGRSIGLGLWTVFNVKLQRRRSEENRR